MWGVEAWNNTADTWGLLSDDYVTWERPTDLSGARLGYMVANRVLADGARLQDATNYQQINFDYANLAGTQFHWPNFSPPQAFDFSDGQFNQADLQGANLARVNLTNARFYHASLRNTILDHAIVDDADFSTADLTGADLTATEPWRAQLFRGPVGSDVPTVAPERTINSVADLIEVCLEAGRENLKSTSSRLYFRGQERNWEVRPSVMRDAALRDNEGRMLLEMMTRRPQDFADMSSALDQWVLAQHHGLKTRLLDVTRNPLVALYFACAGLPQDDGVIHAFTVPEGMVKPYNSDAISVVANFARLSYAEQSLLLGKPCDFGRRAPLYADVMIKLYHHIGIEKPNFQPRVDPRDLFKVFVVEPRQSVERLRAQSGAFLISAFHERFETDQVLGWNSSIPTYEHRGLRVPAKRKPCIRSELELLGITRETLYPGLDETANAVTEHYRSSEGIVNRGAS